MSALFTPLTLGELSLDNRIVIAPMCQYSANQGQATDWHLMHLGQLALSGAGLLIIEATAVQAAGRITPADLGLYDDACEAALHRVLQSVRAYSAMPIGIQLAHAGRKASSHVPWEGGGLLTPAQGGWQAVAPSAIAHASHEAPPAALNEAQMGDVIDAFVSAAQRAARLGLDLVEVHAAHGYLLHQFLSPLSNQRTDDYGGSLANRMRFPLRVLQAVRAALPASCPMGVRVSATDWVEGGWDLAQSLAFSQAAQACGCAYVHVSSGGISPEQRIPLAPGYQLPLAQATRQAVDVPVIGVGLITQAQQAEAAIHSGQADLVALARAMLYNPRWPWHAAAELGAQVQAPKPYWRCQPAGLKDLFAGARSSQR